MKWTLHHESTAAIGEKVIMGQFDYGRCIGTPSAASLKRRFLGNVEYCLFVPARIGSTADAATVLRESPLAMWQLHFPDQAKQKK